MIHQDIDRKNLAMAKRIAKKIEDSPELFDVAKKFLEKWKTSVDVRAMPYLKEWDKLFHLGMKESLDFFVEESERGDAYRQMSPFIGILTEEERLDFNYNWNIENFGEPGIFGKPKYSKVINKNDLEHILNMIDIIPNQLSSTYLIGEQCRFFEDKDPINAMESNMLAIGTLDTRHIDEAHWKSMGENSPFHTMFGYYVRLFDIKKLSLNEDWLKRVSRHKIGTHLLWTLSVHDLPYLGVLNK